MTKKSLPGDNQIEQVILGICLVFPETQERIFSYVDSEDFTFGPNIAIYNYIYNYYIIEFNIFYNNIFLNFFLVFQAW